MKRGNWNEEGKRVFNETLRGVKIGGATAGEEVEEDGGKVEGGL